MLFITFKNNSRPHGQTEASISISQARVCWLCVCVCVNACICTKLRVCSVFSCRQCHCVPTMTRHPASSPVMTRRRWSSVCATLCRVRQTASPLTSSLWDGDVAAVTGDGAKANDGGHWQCVWCVWYFCCAYRGWSVFFSFQTLSPVWHKQRN